jgi:hypothetical protein
MFALTMECVSSLARGDGSAVAAATDARTRVIRAGIAERWQNTGV